jgi:glucose/arabinose dehydrogenase
MRALTRIFPAATVATCAALITACGGGDGGGKTAAPPPTQDHQQGPIPTGNGEGGVKLTQIGDFTEPVYVTQPAGEKRNLFVVDRPGQIRVVRDGKAVPRPFLDVSGEIAASTGAGEQGLLSMAFAPDYASSGLFYVYYTNPSGNLRIVEYQRSADDPLRADPDSAREVLGIPHSEYENHNGGLLLFGPDGYLYAGIGDGGGGGDQDRRGQDLSTLLAKMLRIDPHPQGGKPYSVPKDNPFVGQAGARPEIYEYGLRNPWRFSFDPANDALLIGDVGQDEFEEIDYLARSEQAGANLGWSAFEGNSRFNKDVQAPGAIPPIFTYSRDQGCSISGGYVVRDKSLRSLYGRYIFGDFCAGDLRSLIPSASGARDEKELGESVSALSSFGEDSAGHLYATSLDGPVYRIDPG